MNKHVVWISAATITVALILALVAPALAAESVTPVASSTGASLPTATMSRLTSPVPLAAFAETATAPATPVAKVAKAPKAAAKHVTVKKTSNKKSARHTSPKSTTGAKTATASAPKTSGSTDLATARSVLAGLKATHKYLDGVTVEIGTTPGGYQAVCYYTKGLILISTKHTASISRILKHEIWHEIDWRDNGHIDWGENVPPKNAADYRK